MGKKCKINICQKMRELLLKCDLFKSTQLLRYKEEPEYRSATGGFCSLLLIIVFAIIFTQTFINTFERIYITSSSTLSEEIEPSFFQTTTSPFLFAIGLQNFNLNDPTVKYFNILLTQKIQNNVSKNKSSIRIPLVQCDRNEWASLNESLGAAFDSIGLSNWYCPAPNATFQFQGKFSSDMFKYLKIQVDICSNVSYDPRPCVSQTVINNYITANSSFTLNYYFVNTILNPGNSDYLGYYLEDRNYFQFTKTLGMTANIFVSSFQIDTDQSLSPLVDTNVDYGGVVYEPTQNFVFQPTNSYIQLFLRKSSLSLNIQRSFKKIDQTLSYIGGLFSTIMTLLFMIHLYNQFSYEIDIGGKLMKYDKQTLFNSSKFNLITFLGYIIFGFLNKCGLCSNWKTMNLFEENREEIGKQLDIRLMIRKITFLEDCMNFLFNENQLKGLHLKGRITLNQAEKTREKYNLHTKTKKLMKKHIKKQGEIKQPNDKLQKTVDFLKVDNKEQIQNKLETFSQGLQQTMYNESGNKLKRVEKVLNEKMLMNEKQSEEAIDQNIDNKSMIHTTTELIPKQEKPEEVEGDDSMESEDDQNQEIVFLEQVIDCISELKREATTGNPKSKKIFDSLDSRIKSLAKVDKSTMIIQKRQRDQTKSNSFELIEMKNKNSMKIHPEI